jgi:hypothetical protein
MYAICELTIYLVISLPKILFIHRICLVLANPKKQQEQERGQVGAMQGRSYGSCWTN